ncbi:MAG: DUF1080 domain-containing protein [Chloroflexi bacterium]|nr:DUF1080 domain-containing protein [Chloroflexota bacterium]
MDPKPKAPVGYDDTPLIPGTLWRVHDGRRPQPKVVTAAPGQPPSDAVVLFDGKDLSAWKSAKDGTAAGWKVEHGYMEVVHGAGAIQTKEHFGDCQLHLEWATPAVVEGDSQGRGNSGVFFLGKYEIQVLDSYNNVTYADGHAGAIYGQYPPLANAMRGPGEWNVYDMVFIAPRWDGTGKLISPAYITVFLNGVLVQHCQSVQGPTGHKTVSSYDNPHPPTGPLELQDHRNPVRFRNIWIRPLG